MTERGEDTSIDLPAIRQVLETAPVRLAVLYGSQARGEATASSDVDLAVAFEEIPPEELTRARLALVERLTAALNTDDVDVVPLSGLSPELRHEIREDGIVLVGSADDLDAYPAREPATSHEERLDAFDELLAEMERVV